MKDLNKNKFEKALLKMQQPARYLGTEINAYNKTAANKVLMCFPDDYTIGMSSLGFHTVCNIIDLQEDFCCERAFASAKDMESWLRQEDFGLISLESKMPAKSFNIIGFSVHYELSYTTLVNMLELGGLEVFRKDRKESDPIIICGGTACSNPLILSEFVDLIVIGEAEAVLPELLALYKQFPNKNLFLKNASGIIGVYVPGISKKIQKAVFKEFDNRYYPCAPPVPLVDIPHNRLNIELNRACAHNCRFCQASNLYSPYRQKSIKEIVEIARSSIASTGYEELVLTSLSATDHPDLLEIMDELDFAFRDLGVSVVLSSMRPEKFNYQLAQRLSRLRSGGLTFAPETASERLKKVLNKKIDNMDIIRSAKLAAELGWKRLKLYFLIGIPGETEEDLMEIVDLLKKIRKESGLAVSISVNPIVPQAHTAFQWLNQEDPEILKDKIKFLRKHIGNSVRFFHVEQYILESLLARSDESMAKVVYQAYKNGARLEQWSEHFNFDFWRSAFKECGFDWEQEYFKKYDVNVALPWDFIDMKVNKELLKNSYNEAIKCAAE